MTPLRNDMVQEILSDLIDLPEEQMRREVDRDELHVLAENIKANGLINPITVRPVGDRYELVAGQRRLLAMRIAGIIRIPCVVRDLDRAKAHDIMAAENLERVDVNIIDESNFILTMMTGAENEAELIAKRLKRGVAYVEKRIAVAQMPDYMKEFLRTGQLKLGAALLLMQIEPDDKRKLWAGLAVQNNETERGIEYWVYQHTLGTLPEAVSQPSDIPGAPAAEYKVDMFRCGVDGKEYPASECQAIFIYKGNMSVLEQIRAELNAAPVA